MKIKYINIPKELFSCQNPSTEFIKTQEKRELHNTYLNINSFPFPYLLFLEVEDGSERALVVPVTNEFWCRLRENARNGVALCAFHHSWRSRISYSRTCVRSFCLWGCRPDSFMEIGNTIHFKDKHDMLKYTDHKLKRIQVRKIECNCRFILRFVIRRHLQMAGQDYFK